MCDWNLGKFYSRYKKIVSKFQEKYGTVPELFARAPGRVNLIGTIIIYFLLVSYFLLLPNWGPALGNTV